MPVLGGFGGPSALGRALSGFEANRSLSQGPLADAIQVGQSAANVADVLADAAPTIAMGLASLADFDFSQVTSEQVAKAKAGQLRFAQDVQEAVEGGESLRIASGTAAERLVDRERQGMELAEGAGPTSGPRDGARDQMGSPLAGMVPREADGGGMMAITDLVPIDSNFTGVGQPAFSDTSLGGGFSFQPSVSDDPIGADPVGSGGGGFLGGLLDVIQQGVEIATPLARAGVIRGDVGEALSGGNVPAVQPGATAQPFAGSLAGILEAVAGDLIADAGRSMVEGALGDDDGEDDAVEFDESAALEATLRRLQTGQLAPRVNGNAPASCPSLFRMSTARPYIPSRVQVMGPDGQVYVLANLGRATRGSREGSVLKRLARDNGMVCRRRGGR